jgi:succinyl-CoA synthetase beta subunit
MNIHEYQAKEVLKKYGVAVQEGLVASTVDEAVSAAHHLQAQTQTQFFVIKAQIHAGGRGKGNIEGTAFRGVMVAKSFDDLKEKAAGILGGNLVTIQTGPKGKRVNKVLIAQDVYYPGPNPTKEFYMSMLLDRATGKNVVIYTTEGGMDIEEVAHKTPEKMFKEYIDPALGMQGFQARKIAYNLGLSGEANKQMVKFVSALYKAYISADAAMIEINPLFKTSDDKIIAVDAKLSFDDNGIERHPDLMALRDETEEDPTEVEAKKHNLNYVKLDGNVGCMVNGAGLAMATMDIIKLSGGEPANFLDVGGTANATTVEAGFRIILSDPNVKAILINIFGGIVRCDRVAQGVVDAYKNIGDIHVPIIVRLQGTNAEEAKKLIDESGLEVHSAIQLKEAADLVSEILNARAK